MEVSLSKEFKAKTNEILDMIIFKMKDFEGKLPLDPSLIQMARTMFIDTKDGGYMIDNFLKESYSSWDDIYLRDEKSLVASLNTEIENQLPLFSSMTNNVVEFVIKNREELFGKEYEETLWDNVMDLIRISIKYIYVKRAHKLNPEGVLKPTQRYAPEISVRKESTKFNVELSTL